MNIFPNLSAPSLALFLHPSPPWPPTYTHALSLPHTPASELRSTDKAIDKTPRRSVNEHPAPAWGRSVLHWTFRSSPQADREREIFGKTEQGLHLTVWECLLLIIDWSYIALKAFMPQGATLLLYRVICTKVNTACENKKKNKPQVYKSKRCFHGSHSYNGISRIYKNDDGYLKERPWILQRNGMQGPAKVMPF